MFLLILGILFARYLISYYLWNVILICFSIYRTCTERQAVEKSALNSEPGGPDFALCPALDQPRDGGQFLKLRVAAGMVQCFQPKVSGEGMGGEGWGWQMRRGPWVVCRIRGADGVFFFLKKRLGFVPQKNKQGREATRFLFTWYLSWKIHQKLSSHIALRDGEERNFSNSLPEQKDWKRNKIHVIIAYLFIYSLKFTWSYSQIHNHLHSNPSFLPIFHGLLLLLITPSPRQPSLESTYFGVNLEKKKQPKT